MTDPTSADVTSEPLVAVDPTPDPSIAPGVDPAAPVDESAGPDVTVRFDGADDLTVIGVGQWAAGDTKTVPAWLAARLLQRADFTAVDPAESAAPDVVVDAAPTRVSRRKTATDADVAEPDAPASDA